jgi:preprotein translocase subunit YajC
MKNVTLDFILLQAEASKGNPFMQFLPLVLIMVVFYFFMIRPQMKKAKDQKKFREGIKMGDKIVTIGGIHGKILSVQDTTFIIEVEGGNRLKIEKSAISMENSATLPQQ